MLYCGKSLSAPCVRGFAGLAHVTQLSRANDYCAAHFL